MKIKLFGALRDASYMDMENREQKQFGYRQLPVFECRVRCSQQRVGHHTASYRSIKPESSPRKDQTSSDQ